jgi:GT2 family glycosyltransferase
VYKPIKVIDIELSNAIADMEGLEGYASVQGLVRLHGVPLGYVRMSVAGGCCRKSDIAKAILDEYKLTIADRLSMYGTGGRSQPNTLTLEDIVGTSRAISISGAFPLVTVSVCTRDRSNDLVHCLNGLIKLSYPNLEVIVIDNAPVTDITERLVRQQYPFFRYCREPRPGLDWARNRAIMEATGDIIAYIDDDAVADPGWITALMKTFAESSEIMAVTGLVVPLELETEAQYLFEVYGGFGKGFERKWGWLDPSFDYKDRFPYCTRFGSGTNMAFRRKIFDHIGLFDPALDVGTPTAGGGDLEILFRLLQSGYVLVYEPSAIVRHRHRSDDDGLKKQIASWGTGFYAYLVRTALAYPKERIGVLRFGLWWFWKRDVRRWLDSYRPKYQDRLGGLRSLIRSELGGSLLGPLFYLMARRKAKAIEDRCSEYETESFGSNNSL